MVASLVYYVTSYFFPPHDTFVDGLISADDAVPMDKQYEKGTKSPTDTVRSGTEAEDSKKSINVETVEARV